MGAQRHNTTTSRPSSYRSGTSALLLSKLLKNGTLKVYEKYPHGMATTHADVINADLLAFIKG